MCAKGTIDRTSEDYEHEKLCFQKHDFDVTNIFKGKLYHEYKTPIIF